MKVLNQPVEINIIKKRIIKFDRTPAFITITSINFNAKTYHILFHLEKKTNPLIEFKGFVLILEVRGKM